ncbi:monofunctional biosynthetic peptidoglycan transglycosylase [Pantoea sp. 18069]|uniref:monofunctional biosynthetic peptidoglycan transglycosylase n=1 Tax=Pantoea sp. 18069 TaxID=2681415 RepID=UPI00190F3847|nr:monofunctional biosynthetic peptidoglycan transglycosylase [Pantoea sp. 18069]
MRMQPVWRWLALLLCGALLLELFFVGRIAAMAVIDPSSTSVQRSEAWQQLRNGEIHRWRQQWVPYAQISDHLKRAVVAAEDDGFVDHSGIEWDAIEKAWERNQRAEARAPAAGRAPAKIYGGSTITQQLAKNLLLSGERQFARKGQELVLAKLLELFLTKQRILEIYLNHVEWGPGIFGAEAAAGYYFGKPAARLSPAEAARLAVMLPQPKRFALQPQSTYLAQRARAIMRRMGHTVLP